MKEKRFINAPKVTVNLAIEGSGFQVSRAVTAAIEAIHDGRNYGKEPPVRPDAEEMRKALSHGFVTRPAAGAEILTDMTVDKVTVEQPARRRPLLRYLKPIEHLTLIEVDAFRYNVDERPDWFTDRVGDNTVTTHPDHCEIRTPNGVLRANAGDWIISTNGVISDVRADEAMRQADEPAGQDGDNVATVGITPTNP